jgi:hypothetical protein
LSIDAASIMMIWMPLRSDPWRWPTTALTLAAACACLSLSLVIDTTAWAAWFHHPIRQPMPQATRDGAQLWRIMLAACAGAMVLVMVGLQASCRELHRDRNRMVLSRKRLWTILVILAVALIFRAARLTESLWYDEIAAWLAYGVGIDSPGPIIGNYFDPVNHVFHTLLSWCSVLGLERWIGAEISLRLPALAFSLLSVLMMYEFARAVLGQRVAVLAATITAIAPVSILEGVEARGYSMMICFSALANWTLIEARRRERPGVWLLYALCCALGAWTHFVTVFVPFGHALWIAWRAIRHREWKLAWCGGAALALAAILTATLYAPMLPDMLAGQKLFFASAGDERSILGIEGQHALLQLGGSWYWWAALPGLTLALIGLVRVLARWRFSALRESASDVAPLDAVGLALLGLPLMIFVVALSESWMYARFTLFAMPGAILLMAAGLDFFFEWKRGAAVAALAITAAAWISDIWFRPPKQPLRDAAAYVRAKRTSDQRLLAIGLAHEVLRVYARDLELTYSLRHGADLSERLAATNPMWMIVEYPKSVGPDTYDSLQKQGFIEKARFAGWVDWSNGDVIVYGRER